MTVPLRAAQLPVKYERLRETHRAGQTIYEVPGSGLYRVLELNHGEYTVETLTQLGWTTLIKLDEQDKASTVLEAMQIWLDIQTPARNVRQEEESEGDD
ncbi:hypothetical protein ACIQF8_03470 [Pseudarthrobacter sp. NPDC092184]|jgi:hypothetical protein|uniref:hypothetical protein n=1 Tax=Micrococcaceae TaxID=1268 RepID=UPI00214830A6|nr:hypothetical protein [Paenarthrobacter sp. UW852]MCR1163236.1 hypothetical protein [Paenarthrobacter sp. UW852]